MNLVPNDVEVAIIETTRRFCTARFGRDRLREMVAGTRLDRVLWVEAASQGWFSLARPESAGGAGLGWAASSLVLKEVGRALVPGPVRWSHLAATFLDDEVAESVAAGDIIVTGTMSTGASAPLVTDLDLADLVLLVNPDAVLCYDAADVVAKQLPSLDPTRSVHRVVDAGRGREVGDAGVSALMRRGGMLLTAAEAAGGAAAIRDLAVEYAKERVQFGAPIGSFQAVKHLCADIAVSTKAADDLVAWAAVNMDGASSAEADTIVAMAKLVACSAFLSACRSSIQVFGAIGYTWEHDAHLFLKRAHALDLEFGDHIEHAERLGRELVAVAERALDRTVLS